MRNKTLQSFIATGRFTLPAVILIAICCWTAMGIGTGTPATRLLPSFALCGLMGYLLVETNNNFALMRAPIATGCAKCDPGSSIARICMYDYVALPIVWSVKINLYRHQAMVAGQNCKAGLNLQNREQQSLRRRHRLRCRLPARRYWMST